MKRIPEPELMVEPEQVVAYAHADFEDPHSNFVKLFKKYIKDVNVRGRILDLGCGPGDITFRFASEFRDSYIYGIDGSREMINFANNLLIQKNELSDRVKFICSIIDDYDPGFKYDYIISNSLLHHISEPSVFWHSINRNSKSGTNIFIMDLFRPNSIQDAKRLVELYVCDEPEILKRDFFNSLLSAFEINEIKEQLERSELDLVVRKVSDRHVIIFGKL